MRFSSQFLSACADAVSGDPLYDLWMACEPGQKLTLLLEGVLQPTHQFAQGDGLVKAMVRKEDFRPRTYSTASRPADGAFPVAPEGPWRTPDDTGQILPFLIAACAAHGAAVFWEGEPDALDWALSRGWDPLVRALLARSDCPTGTELDRRLSNVLLPYRAQRALPWLHALAKHGNTGLIRDWLAAGADANALDGFGRSAVFYAANGPTAQALLDAGARWDIRDECGKTVAEFWLNPAEGALSEKGAGERQALLTRQTGNAEALAFAAAAGGDATALRRPELCGELVTTSARLMGVNADWGPLGFLGASWLTTDSYHLGGLKQLASSLPAFFTQVQATALQHESLPGIADAWILAEALAARSNNEPDYGDSKSEVTRAQHALHQVMAKAGFGLDAEARAIACMAVARAAMPETRHEARKALIKLWEVRAHLGKQSRGQPIKEHEWPSKLANETLLRLTVAAGQDENLRKVWARQLHPDLIERLNAPELTLDADAAEAVLAIAAESTVVTRRQLTATGYKNQRPALWQKLMNAWQVRGITFPLGKAWNKEWAALESEIPGWKTAAQASALHRAVSAIEAPSRRRGPRL